MIFYKSTHDVAPSWMAAPAQRNYKSYFVYVDKIGERVPQYWPAPDCDWQLVSSAEQRIDTDNEIEFCLVGPFMPQVREVFEEENRRIKTPCGSSVPIFPALDRAGVVWTVPLICDSNGPMLALKWKADGEAVIRVASEQQQAILDTCEALQQTFCNEDLGMGSLPLKVAAKAASLIMSYSYHVHPVEFMTLGLLDDFIVPRILWAATGYGTPENPVDVDEPVEYEKVGNG